MFCALADAVVEYHRGLRNMPTVWKPWLVSLLVANMIVPVFWFHEFEAQIVFTVACLNYITFVVLTHFRGFTRILGLAHIYWIPMIGFLWTRLEMWPADTVYGFWIRIVMILDAGSIALDFSNVVRYALGDRKKMSFKP